LLTDTAGGESHPALKTLPAENWDRNLSILNGSIF